MATIDRFEDLIAWQKSRVLNKEIYKATLGKKFATDFTLRDQITRASISVMANIAEGFERNGNKEFSQFLSVSKSSAGEVRSHLYVALDLEYITQEQFDELYKLAITCSKIISGLMEYIKNSEMKGSKFMEDISEYHIN